MSRYFWRGPALRLELAHPQVRLETEPPGRAPLATARLDAPDFGVEMRRLAARVRRRSGRLTVVLPEPEVWRGRLPLGRRPSDEWQAAAAATVAVRVSLPPEGLAVTLGPVGEDEMVPVAAVRRQTLAQTQAFLAQFGLKPARIVGAGSFKGFAGPPRLDAPARRLGLLRLAAPLYRLAGRVRQGVGGWLAARRPARFGIGGLLPARLPDRRVLAAGAAVAALLVAALTLLAWPADPEPPVETLRVETPAPAAPAVVTVAAPAETRPSEPAVVRVGPELEPIPTVVLRPMPAPVPRPERPAVAGASLEEPQASAAPPALSAPGIGGRPTLPGSVTQATRNFSLEAAALPPVPLDAAPAPGETLLRRAQLQPLPVPERVAALDLRPRDRPHPAPTGLVTAAPAPVGQRPQPRPQASEAALAQAIDAAVAQTVRSGTATAATAAAAMRPAPRRFVAAAPAQVRVARVVEAIPRQTLRAAPAAPVRQPVAQATNIPQAAPMRVAAVAPQVGLTRNALSLIGIFGTSDRRHALVRLPNATVARVGPGDRVQGHQVAAVTKDAVHLRGGGRDLVLRLDE